MQLHEDRFVLHPRGEFFADTRIYTMLPFSPSEILIGSREKGLFLMDKNGVKPFPCEIESYLINNQLYHGDILADGSFALATLRGGVVIINKQGQTLHVLNRSVGIQDSSVMYVYADDYGGLWLALDRNISRVQIPASFTIFGEMSGLSGAILR